MIYQIPGTRPQVDQGATVQPSYVFPVNQPDQIAYAQLQRQRFHPEVPVVPYLATTPTRVSGTGDWALIESDILWSVDSR